ncbi:MAG TPA: hypothetical protein VHC49_05115 [Mycobacteriales bacterium]|nr:hypothetical protein [Mycobacteriales bacterium]
MTHAMIWTFGILAFFLIIIVAALLPGRHRGADVLTPRMAKAQEAAKDELRSIGGQLSDIQQRLDSMERILKEVE